MTAVWHTPLTPLAFLRRSAEVFPDKTAIAYGDRRRTYTEFAAQVPLLTEQVVDRPRISSRPQITPSTTVPAGARSASAATAV